jgi:hypothetical protein
MILCCLYAITHISFVFSPIKVFQIKHIITLNFYYTVQLVKLQVLLVVELRHTWSPGWHRLVQKCRSQPFRLRLVLERNKFQVILSFSMSDYITFGRRSNVNMWVTKGAKRITRPSIASFYPLKLWFPIFLIGTEISFPFCIRLNGWSCHTGYTLSKTLHVITHISVKITFRFLAVPRFSGFFHLSVIVDHR